MVPNKSRRRIFIWKVLLPLGISRLSLFEFLRMNFFLNITNKLYLPIFTVQRQKIEKKSSITLKTS